MKQRHFNCGLEATLAVIGGKWKPLILYHLAYETRRYGELRRAIGAVSHKVLSQQLKELETDGIVDRVDHHEIPPRVDYSLTPLGKTLAKTLAPLCEWGATHEQAIMRMLASREDENEREHEESGADARAGAPSDA